MEVRPARGGHEGRQDPGQGRPLLQPGVQRLVDRLGEGHTVVGGCFQRGMGSLGPALAEELGPLRLGEQCQRRVSGRRGEWLFTHAPACTSRRLLSMSSCMRTVCSISCIRSAGSWAASLTHTVIGSRLVVSSAGGGRVGGRGGGGPMVTGRPFSSQKRPVVHSSCVGRDSRPGSGHRETAPRPRVGDPPAAARSPSRRMIGYCVSSSLDSRCRRRRCHPSHYVENTKYIKIQAHILVIKFKSWWKLKVFFDSGGGLVLAVPGSFLQGKQYIIVKKYTFVKKNTQC